MMATKKVGGSTKNGRDSKGRRLGVKVNDNQKIHEGSIIIRQRGKKYKCGKNTFMGVDHTIHALISGTVFFKSNKLGTFVSVLSV